MRILTSLVITAALVGCTRDGGGDTADDSGVITVADADGDGVPDDEDAFPDDPEESVDSDGDGTGDNGDAFPDDDTETTDTDGDGVGDNADAFPDDAAETTDTDGDGTGDNGDAFPDDAAETTDTDGDGTGDNADVFPEDATENADTDGDGVGDNADNCLNAENADQADADEDGVGDACEGDRDSDGVVDDLDAFPDDPNETVDTDGDGVGDNGDAFPEDATETVDTDGDGVGDNGDAFPEDATESKDTDGDGVGDNADAFPEDDTETVDTDGDGVGDNGDAFPNDDTESKDTDGDGVGDNADAFPEDDTETKDTDGDGVGDNADAFPEDETETVDTDGDTVGDNADNCKDQSNADQADLDGDGLGNTCDGDRDGDGVDNGDDAFPDNKDETKDTDGDGVGDNADAFPEDAEETADSDNDGSGDNADCDDGNDQIFPGQTESCNDIDDNCSGTADDGTALGSEEACAGGSCLDIKKADSSLSDGAYFVDANGDGTSQEVYCDMTTDGGGYTFFKVSSSSAQAAPFWETTCDAMGMQFFVPRTQAHLAAALEFAADTNIDATAAPAGRSSRVIRHMTVIGVYPVSAGATCNRIALNSDDCSNWRATDDGPYWTTDRNDISEPNGDNLVDASMYYWWSLEGEDAKAHWYNDIRSQGYTSAYAMCDVGDKWGDGVER